MQMQEQSSVNSGHCYYTQEELNMTLESAYTELGLTLFSSLEQVKTQYRRLALSHHPDKVQGDSRVKKAAHDDFSRISAAYEFLTSRDTQTNVETPILYSTSFTDPYQLFRQSFDVGPITIPYRVVSGYLTAEAQPHPKRTYEEISPPSSPITTAVHAFSSKRIKVEHYVPPPPLLIRSSVKRDSWAVDQSSFAPTKRMRMSPIYI